MSVFSKNITWQLSGATSFQLSVNGRVVSTSLSGSITVDPPGNNNISYRATFDRRGTVVINSDGQTKVSENNNRIERRTREVACSRYAIPNSRTSCRSGYRKISLTEYREVYKSWGHINGVRSAQVSESNARITQGSWQANQPSVRGRSCTTGHFWVCVEGLPNESRTNYFCTPESGCTDEEEYDHETFTANLNGSFTVFNERTQAEEEARRQEERERERIQQERTDEERRQREEEIARQIEENNRIAREALEKGYTSRTSVAPIPTSTSQETKYRIISPIVYDTINGKQVEQLRYESVRLLSPESVSSYVIRGYEVHSVDQDTPLSYSKPYGPSVLARARLTKERSTLQGRGITPPGRRRTIQEMKKLSESITKEKRSGSIIKRDLSNRRIVE